MVEVIFAVFVVHSQRTKIDFRVRVCVNLSQQSSSIMSSQLFRGFGLGELKEPLCTVDHCLSFSMDCPLIVNLINSYLNQLSLLQESSMYDVRLSRL